MQIEEAVVLAEHMYIRPGASVFEPGDEDENCYIVLSGVIEEVYSGYLAGGQGEEKVSHNMHVQVHTKRLSCLLSIARYFIRVKICVLYPIMRTLLCIRTCSTTRNPSIIHS